MKIFHLSDLHIGIKLYHRDLSDDQKYIFRQIADYAAERKPDAILIAGDIYDRSAPSAESVDLFDAFLRTLRRSAPDAAVMMISGNHDSASRINCFRSILADENIYMIGRPPESEEERIEQVTLTDEYGPVHFWLLPFVKPSMVRKITMTEEDERTISYEEAVRRLFAREEIDASARNVIVSHQFYIPRGTDAGSVERMDSEFLTIGNIDAVTADVLDPFDYAALGHIHKPMRVGSEFRRYAGTPSPYSISEAGQQKGVIEITLGRKGDVRTEVLPLRPLHEVRKVSGSLADVLAESSDDYVWVELTEKAAENMADVRSRLNQAFPNLLKISRVLPASPEEERAARGEEGDLSPFQMCLAFAPDLDPDEQAILMEIINEVSEGEEEDA